jgi:hypothetical protein
MIVPRAHLEEHIKFAKLIIAGKFSELVFNLEEVGFLGLRGSETEKIIVPRSVPSDDVYHSVFVPQRLSLNRSVAF